MITWSTYDEKIADYLIKNDNHIVGVSNDNGRIKFEFEVFGKLCVDVDEYYRKSGSNSFREWIRNIASFYNDYLMDDTSARKECQQ